MVVDLQQADASKRMSLPLFRNLLHLKRKILRQAHPSPIRKMKTTPQQVEGALGSKDLDISLRIGQAYETTMRMTTMNHRPSSLFHAVMDLYPTGHLAMTLVQR